MQNKDRSFFGFLARGVTTTHPLCSVFTLLILCFFLISLCFPLNRVSASVFSIAVPSVPFDIGPLLKSYDQLSDDQRKIADAIAGSYGTSYSGWAGYSYSGSWTDAAHDLADQITDFGSQIFDSLGNLGEFIVDPLGSASRAVVDVLGGAVVYAAEQTSSFSDWWSDNIYDADSGGGAGKSFIVDASPSGSLQLNQGFMNLVGPGIGLYDWQFNTSDWYNNSFSWINTTATGSVLLDYNNAVSNLPSYRLFGNIKDYSYNRADGLVIGYDIEFPKYDLFIDTYNHLIYFHNAPDVINVSSVFTVSSRYLYNINNSKLYFSPRDYTLLNFSSYNDIAAYYLNTDVVTDSLIYYYYSNQYSGVIIPTLFLNKVYVGANWDSRQEIYNVDDLNFDDTYERTSIDNPTIPFAIDIAKLITTLIDKLAGTQDAVDGVSIKDAVIGATIDKATGETITRAQTERIAVQVQYPSSGIIVPDGLFSNLGKYITYLYQQTQPLILYTRDLITALTFDGTGLSWVFFGAVSVGLIGGIICKFLL